MDGILIKFKPLFIILATNPVKSPTTPPPIAIKTSDRLKLFFKHFSVRLLTFLKDFKFSLVAYSNIKI